LRNKYYEVFTKNLNGLVATMTKHWFYTKVEQKQTFQCHQINSIVIYQEYVLLTHLCARIRVHQIFYANYLIFLNLVINANIQNLNLLLSHLNATRYDDRPQIHPLLAFLYLKILHQNNQGLKMSQFKGLVNRFLRL